MRSAVMSPLSTAGATPAWPVRTVVGAEKMLVSAPRIVATWYR